MIRVLYFFIGIMTLVQTSTPREKYTYQEKPILTWADFKGTPPIHAFHMASVNTGIAFSYKVKQLNSRYIITYDVRSEFYPELSWKKNLEESDPHLLNHEQQHWNISHVYSIKLRKALEAYKPTKNYRQEINAIFKSVESQRQQLQAVYDKETQHGINSGIQQQWEIKVAEMMLKE